MKFKGIDASIITAKTASATFIFDSHISYFLSSLGYGHNKILRAIRIFSFIFYHITNYNKRIYSQPTALPLSYLRALSEIFYKIFKELNRLYLINLLKIIADPFPPRKCGAENIILFCRRCRSGRFRRYGRRRRLIN